jgi:hypothetical protein
MMMIGLNHGISSVSMISDRILSNSWFQKSAYDVN